MATTCELAEFVLCYLSSIYELRQLTETMACATTEQNAGAIIVLSKSGHNAHLVSKYCPSQTIIVVTRDEHTARQSHLSRGVFPFTYTDKAEQNWDVDVENGIRWGIIQGTKFGLLKSNDSAVVVQGLKGDLGNTNTIRVLVAP